MHSYVPRWRVSPLSKSRRLALVAALIMLIMLLGSAVAAKALASAKDKHGIAKLSRSTAITTSPATLSGSGGPLGIPGKWRLTLNATPTVLATWPRQTPNGMPFNPLRELDCYKAANVVNNKTWLSLLLTRSPSQCGGMHKRYSGAVVESLGKFSQMYGVWEAKIWMAATRSGKIYDWPAWWLAGMTPRHEIDIAEGMLGWAWQLSHHNPSFFHHEAVSRGWHTFAVQVTSSFVSWWLDGHRIAMLQTADYAGVPMIAMLDMTTHYFLPQNQVLMSVPATLQVAYVKAWEPA